MSPRLTLIFAALFILVSCSRSGDTPVPRPMAYPRIPVHDSVYTAVPLIPIHFELPTAAHTTIDSSHTESIWINAAYPAYKATLHCTITPVTGQTAHEIIRNRTERMSLNTGGHPTEITQLTSPSGYESQILLTPSGTVTPVQFISVSPQWVVSGALYIQPHHSSPDSVAPILRAVRRDLIHASKTIR